MEGNYIGIDASGTQASGSGGVDICDGATDNTIGGTIAGARNVIAGSDIDQIVIEDSGTSRNLVEGNYIGTDASGTLPNPLAFSPRSVVSRSSLVPPITRSAAPPPREKRRLRTAPECQSHPRVQAGTSSKGTISEPI